MSKYVPSFVKQQQASSTSQEQSASQQTASQQTASQQTDSSIWNRSGNNRFAALSDDFPMNKRDRPDSRFGGSSTMKAGTMASFTSNNVSSGGGNKSFASKFSEQMRRAEDPNYVPPPKPLNVNSQDDFPTLGGGGSVKKSLSQGHHSLSPSGLQSVRQSVMTNQQPASNKPSGNKWASMAKAWAQQDEDEREAKHAREVEEERQRIEMELLRSMPLPTFSHSRRYNEYSDDDQYDEEDDYNQEEKDSYEYESSEPEDEPLDNRGSGVDGDEEGEFNSNTVWDGRRKDDLY
jgi:hypothetical protein